MFQSIVDSMRSPILVLDASLRVQLANRPFYRRFSLSPADTLGCRLEDLPAGICAANPRIEELLTHVFSTGERLEDFPVTQNLAGGVRRRLLLSANRWVPKSADPAARTTEGFVMISFEDVSKGTREIEGTAVFRALKRAYEREKRIAEEFERPLMTEIPEDAFPGLSLATLYEAASDEADVGGDFVDAFALPRGLVALAIADASGKGLDAAIRTLQVKNVLRAFAREDPHQPTRVLSRLNDYVCDTLRYDCGTDGYYFGGFVCMTLVILDPHTGEGTLVSAGCEPPTILRREGSVESIGSHGLPLGIQQGTPYEMASLQLKGGDTLVLSTDGVTEARTRGDHAFLGYSGMLGLAQEHRAAPSVRAMAQGILEGARLFGDGVLRDDACLLIARKND